MTSTSNQSRRGLIGALALTLLMLAALEIRFPYYFLQDDGLEYYLPVYFHNWRSLVHGELPLYNFHTFAGVPHASMGQPGVFYLPQYFAIFFSQSILGHPFAAIDLLGVMNALLAVAGAYLLLRQLGANDTAAAFGGLTALTGFFFWVGRMWFTTTMLCAWFPWMIWAAVRYLKKPQWSRAFWLLAARVALLYVGHSQYFTLAMVFEHLFALTWLMMARPAGWMSRCATYLGLSIPTVTLGLPFFVPLSAEVGRSLLRSSPLPYHEFSGLRSSPIAWILGQLFVFAPIPNASVIVERSMFFLSYVGYIPTLLSFGTLWLFRRRPDWRSWITAGFVCFAIALLWSWNTPGPLIYYVPIFNRFRFPFKLVYFAGFFQCLLASLVFAKLSRSTRRLLIGGLAANWVLVFLLLPNHAWRVREYHPPLHSPWRESLADGRYFTIAESPFFPVGGSAWNEFVDFNYSLLWGLDDLLGYEPMHSRLGGEIALGDIHTGVYQGSPADLPMDHLKRWSVRYVVVSPSRKLFANKLEAAGFAQRTVHDNWTLWEDPHALPRVRWENQPSGHDRRAGIAWTERVNSIDVDLTEWPAKRLELAFAANPGLQICFGQACRPIPDSADGLIRIDVPPGTSHMRLVYRNGLYLPSFSIAALTLVILGVAAFRARGKTRYASMLAEFEGAVLRQM